VILFSFRKRGRGADLRTGSKKSLGLGATRPPPPELPAALLQSSLSPSSTYKVRQLHHTDAQNAIVFSTKERWELIPKDFQAPLKKHGVEFDPQFAFGEVSELIPPRISLAPTAL